MRSNSLIFLPVSLLTIFFIVSPVSAKAGDNRHLEVPQKKIPRKNIKAKPLKPKNKSPKSRALPPPEVDVTISVMTDDFPHEVSWELLDSQGGVVLSSSEGTYTEARHLYTAGIDLDSYEEYIFNITDSAWDGLCCGFGEGFYDISSDESGIVFCHGAQYGRFQATAFVVYDEGPPPPSEPVSVNIDVMTDEFPSEVSWNLYDSQGSVVASAPEGSYTTPLHLYTTTVELEEYTEYMFNITDLAWDGLCCGFGDGYYDIKTVDGEEILCGGAQYGRFQATAFMAIRFYE